MPYHILARHENPPNPEFTFIYNESSKQFEPLSASWVDWVHSWATKSPSRSKRLRLTPVNYAIAKASRGNRSTKFFAERWDDPRRGVKWVTMTATPRPVDQLPTDFDCDEDAAKYFYYVEADPSIRTETFVVPLHFRGQNPNATGLNQALGSDVLRSICWRESAWRQFNGSGAPLRNRNTNGTID
jgi:hypothetical protein